MIKVEILYPLEVNGGLVSIGRYTAHVSLGKYLFIHDNGVSRGPIPDYFYRVVGPLEQLAEAAE